MSEYIGLDFGRTWACERCDSIQYSRRATDGEPDRVCERCKREIRSHNTVTMIVGVIAFGLIALVFLKAGGAFAAAPWGAF